MINRMEWYLARSVIVAVMAALLLVSALLGFSELLSQLGRLSESYPLSKALLFAVLKMPAYAYDAFPIALLIGVLAGLGQLAVQGELTIVRASGWSPRRILLALAKGLFGFWLIMLLVGEVVAPWAEKHAMQLRLSSGAQHLSLAGNSGFWMKDGKNYLSARVVVSDHLLMGVDVYVMQPHVGITQVISAESATYDNGQWLLLNGRIQAFVQAEQAGPFPFVGLNWQQDRFDRRAYKLPFEPEVLGLMAQEKKNWSWGELRQQIEQMTASGMQTQTLELAMWRKLAHPISLLAMLALSIPLLLTAGRSSSMGGRVLLGIVIGMVFFLANRVVGDLSALAALPPVVGAFALPIVLLLGSWWWLKRIG